MQYKGINNFMTKDLIKEEKILLTLINAFQNDEKEKCS